MAMGLKNLSLIVGTVVFFVIYLTTRHTRPADWDFAADKTPVIPSSHHQVGWDLSDIYTPPPPPPQPPKPDPIPWAEARFKAEAEAEAKRLAEEQERLKAESPEVQAKKAELAKKIEAEQQKAWEELQALEKANAGKLPFQLDLPLDVPNFDVRELRSYAPHNYKGPGHPTIATYLATESGTLRDPYFLAALQNTYRLLYDPRTWSKHCFTVFVAPHVSDEQRDYLSAAGALVRVLEPVKMPATPQFPHWKNQFAKLNMWEQYDFTRILYLDSDAFPMKHIDELLDVPQLGCRRDLLPPEDLVVADIMCQYSFNVALQGFSRVPGMAPEVNVGVILLQPNDNMHRRLIRNCVQTNDWDSGMAEQGYLSHMFRGDGPFPFEMLDRKWNGFFPQADEQETLSIVHEKLWMTPTGWDDPTAWAKNDFQTKHRDMVKLFESENFLKLRQYDGRKIYQ